MPLTPEQDRQLDALLANASGTATAVPEEEKDGIIWRTLEYLNRPYSAVMSGIQAAAKGEDPADPVSKALTGEKQTSAYDLLVDLGADPESNVTKAAGIGLDIFPGGFVDPLTYVTLGFSKAGNVARGIDKFGRAAAEGRSVLSRLEATKKGLYNLNLRVPGIGEVGILPKAAVAPVAAVLDKAGEIVTTSNTYKRIRSLVGGVGWLEQNAPDLARFSQGQKIAMARNEEAIGQQLQSTWDRVAALHGESAADDALKDATRLLEDPDGPARQLARVKQYYDDPGAELRQQDMWTHAQDLENVARVQTGQIIADGAAGDSKILSDYDLPGWLHELKTAIPNIADMPPPLMQSMAMDEWDKVLAGVKNRDEVKSLVELQVPILDDVKQIYETRLRGLDPDFKFPIANYMKHMYPRAASGLVKPQVIDEATWEVMARRLRMQGATQGLSVNEIEKEVARSKKQFKVTDKPLKGVGDIVNITKAEAQGIGDQFTRRKYRATLDDMAKAFPDSKIPDMFEQRSMYMTNAMVRDADRWAFGFDLHKFAAEKYGKTAKELQGIGGDIRKWVPLGRDFNFPWIDQAKRPWQDVYVPDHIAKLMSQQTKGFQQLTTNEGMRAFLDSLHGFRRWYSAWTLNFPSTMTRNLAGDLLKAQQGGLDYMTVSGRDAILASGHLLANRLRKTKAPTTTGRAINAIQSTIPFQSEAAWNKIMGELQTVYPQATPEQLVDIMKADGVLEGGWFRDLDMLQAGRDTVVQDALQRKPKLREFIPLRGLKAELQGKPGGALGESAILRFGYTKNQDIQDFTKVAMWLDRLREAARTGAKFEDAATYATAQTRRHLIDYRDLTGFEQDVLKNVVPFYTFTSRNLPIQLQKLAHDPGSFSWLNRAYQGAWNSFQGDIAPEDIPQWLQDQFGLPVRTVKDADGIEKVSIWNPTGWIPMTEINELANWFRDASGFGPDKEQTGAQFLLGRLTPLLQEPLEQLMNKDTYTGRAIDDGTVRDIFGITFGPGMPVRGQHALQNIRLVHEIDRLNLFGWFTELGHYFGSFTKDRPHRLEAPAGERALAFITGFRTNSVNAIENINREMRSNGAQIAKLKSMVGRAARDGIQAEVDALIAQIENLVNENTQLGQQMNTLRQHRATKEAARNAR